jgi:hypothetical protein
MTRSHGDAALRLTDSRRRTRRRCHRRAVTACHGHGYRAVTVTVTVTRAPLAVRLKFKLLSHGLNNHSGWGPRRRGPGRMTVAAHSARCQWQAAAGAVT